MCNGASVHPFPLPINNPTSMLARNSNVILMEVCPICLCFFSCNNIFVLSCGCMYHPFYEGLHLESKAIHCVNPTCEKPLTSEYITSSSFQQKNLLLKRLKQEKGCNIVSTTRSIQGSISPSSKFPYICFVFIEFYF
jgi:hypothetical protein